ncbi:hypothetical protein GWK47_046265 [Chionoecetes opilio]|uniref:Uncharacterized protein n=1 Tax=Chionoecetes opilio TaxID=41210 RepID=A0A8J4Y5N6_CHIOP|nr:hypothetical protein GWK47_046265 [Chionoecetes opilio]
MINLLHAGAVPFGYTSDKIECDFPGCFEDCVTTSMSCHYIPDVRGTFPLPDVILSNTPPPSPLRRARSCHTFFPDKTETLPPSPLTPPATPGFTADREAGVQALQTGLGHIQEVRRRWRDNSSHNPYHLPQLSWVLPRPPHRMSSRGHVKEDADVASETRSLRDEAEGGHKEAQQRWRLIGADLRMVADQFQLNMSKVSGKPRIEVAAHYVAPAVLGRCLAASLLCLVWWRLYNKLR